MTLEPVAAPQGSPQALVGAVAIPAGGAVPLTFTVRFSLSGYQVAARGQASFARARQIAHAAGIPQTAALESLTGDPLAVDLTAEGPWIPAEETPLINLSPAQTMNAGVSRRDGHSRCRYPDRDRHGARRKLEGRLSGQPRDNRRRHAAPRQRQPPLGPGRLLLRPGQGHRKPHPDPELSGADSAAALPTAVPDALRRSRRSRLSDRAAWRKSAGHSALLSP